MEEWKLSAIYDDDDDDDDDGGRGGGESLGLKVKLSLSTPWRHGGGAKAQLHSFLTSALDGGEQSISHHQFQPQYRMLAPSEQQVEQTP